jgi:hypothetical protein
MRTLRTLALFLLLASVSVLPGFALAAVKDATIPDDPNATQGGGSNQTDAATAGKSTTQTSPTTVSADATKNANDTGAKTGGLTNPLNASSLTDLLQLVLHTIVQLGSILLVVALVWVGFLFVAAQGAEEKIRDARNALVWTVVGGLVLLGAEAISAAIQATVSAL